MLVEWNPGDPKVRAPATTAAGGPEVPTGPQGLQQAHLEPRSVHRRYIVVHIDCTVLLYCIVSHWGACGPQGLPHTKKLNLAPTPVVYNTSELLQYCVTSTPELYSRPCLRWMLE